MTSLAVAPKHDRAPVTRSRTGWIVVWLLVLAVGWCFAQHEAFSVNDPAPGGAARRWPAKSALQRAEHAPTLVLFLHPKCPCSRATINELARLLDAGAGAKTPPPALWVVATVPADAESSWWDTDTIAQARQIPRAQLFVDRGGVEAARFGATTSGFVLLFDPSGARQFAGGITIARGHEGQSTGSDRVDALLRGESAEAGELPAFGCRLCLPESALAQDHSDAEPRDKGRSTTFL